MDIEQLIEKGAIFYVSHSGGKDSQAMYLYLESFIPTEQLIVVHADLGEVEWHGVQDHIKNTIYHDLNVVRANKTLFDMVEHRFETRPGVPSWPSSAHRQCTSDLKRGPIYKFIRADMKKRGSKLAVNCTGIRAQESNARAKQKSFKLLSGKGGLCLPGKATDISEMHRIVYDWKPIFNFTTSQVFETIRSEGQSPFWAYEQNERLSCVFCIMGCKGDLKHGAKHRPDLLDKYEALENKTGYTVFQHKGKNIPIKQYIGV